MTEDWLNRYSELMFGPNHTFESMTEAAKLKFFNMPDKLYKYRAFNDHTWESLKNDTLYVQVTSKQNDLKEANIFITPEAEASVWQHLYDGLRQDYGLPEATVRSLPDVFERMNVRYGKQLEADLANPDSMISLVAKEVLRQMDISFTALMEEVRKSAREMFSICSFSAVMDNNLMWGHYAASNEGCCIEYDFKQLGSEHPHNALMFPVIYVDDNRVYVNHYNPEEGVDRSAGMFAATLKDQEWKYEHEWRRLFLAKDGGKVHKMVKPSAVYMGARIADENKDRLIDLCKSRGITLYQTKYDQHKNQIIVF